MRRQKEYPKSAHVRLTIGEHKRLSALAPEAKLSLSRFLAASGLAGRAPSYEERERQERAIMEVNRVGNNLNQIARQLNAQRGIINLRDVEEALDETRLALEAMKELFQNR